MEGSGFQPGRIGFLIAVMGKMRVRRVDSLSRAVMFVVGVVGECMDVVVGLLGEGLGCVLCCWTERVRSGRSSEVPC